MQKLWQIAKRGVIIAGILAIAIPVLKLTYDSTFPPTPVADGLAAPSPGSPALHPAGWDVVRSLHRSLPPARHPIVAFSANPIDSNVTLGGLGILYDPTGSGWSYTCGAGLRAIPVGYLRTLGFQGAVISFHAAPDKRPKRSQRSVELTFHGPPLQVVNIIVPHAYPPGSKRIHEDEHVVIWLPGMWSRGVEFDTRAFTKGYIPSLTLCIQP